MLPHTQCMVCFIRFSQDAVNGKLQKRAVKKLAKALQKKGEEGSFLVSEKISARFAALFDQTLSALGIERYDPTAYFESLYEKAVKEVLQKADPIHTRILVLDAGFKDENLISAKKMCEYARNVGIVTRRTKSAAPAISDLFVEEGVSISVSDDLSRVKKCDILYIEDLAGWEDAPLNAPKTCKILFNPKNTLHPFSQIPRAIKGCTVYLAGELSGKSAATLKRDGFILNTISAYLYEKGVCKERPDNIKEILWN